MLAVPAATPACGVKTAVYTSGSAVAVSAPSTPPLTLRLAAEKLVGSSEKVNVMMAPSVPLATATLLLMTTVGALWSSA
ncbi:hypothetical protein DUPY_24180 [Duganella phyllosphaerae]|uniref:Uncharacterized protein n=1 Tax=Duganella phyllosphaerae TaxID=762836 RepID=A0A1E7WMV8_9BURK|nr:hypothetical protein DUPY_24180 [Duganella phyllosphaerae]